MATTVELHVNGAKKGVQVEPGQSLLCVLRDELELTGCKYGCGEGQCGACTVLVEGKAVRSCIIDVHECADKQITTIEGLEQNGRLHPLQEAFLAAGALQCGYCTCGMIMSGVALLERNRDPSPDDIVHAMDGNICRCGTYQRIVQAVREAAVTMRGVTP